MAEADRVQAIEAEALSPQVVLDANDVPARFGWLLAGLGNRRAHPNR